MLRDNGKAHPVGESSLQIYVPKSVAGDSSNPIDRGTTVDVAIVDDVLVVGSNGAVDDVLEQLDHG